MISIFGGYTCRLHRFAKGANLRNRWHDHVESALLRLKQYSVLVLAHAFTLSSPQRVVNSANGVAIHFGEVDSRDLRKAKQTRDLTHLAFILVTLSSEAGIHK